MWFFLFFALLHLSFAVDEDDLESFMTIHRDFSCKDWEGSNNLYIERSFVIGVNKTNDRIEALARLDNCFEMDPAGSNSFSFVKGSPFEKVLITSGEDLDWTFGLAVTWRNNDGTEVGDDDIAYGYDAKRMHYEVRRHRCYGIKKGKFGDVSTPFKFHPFRYRKLQLTWTSGKNLLDLETDCNNENPRAWIAQPGLYRLVKENKADFYWENIYYWPRPGMILT